MSEQDDSVAMLHGVDVAERQARAVLMALRDQMGDTLGRYTERVSDDRAQGFSDAIRLIEHAIDGHTASIGDDVPKAAT